MKKLSNLKSGEINYAKEYSKIEEIEKQSNAMLKTRDFFGDL